MNHFYFFVLFFLYYFFFWILGRLVLVLIFFKLAPRKWRERSRWEKDYLSKMKQSKKDLSTDIAIECSSEGEFEQVRYLVEQLLKINKKIDIFFCSPSVESTLKRFVQQYPEHVRINCVPLIHFPLPWSKWFQWSKAPKYLQVKYDFFPHLLFMAQKRSISVLLGAHWRPNAFLNYFFYFPFNFYTTAIEDTFEKLKNFARRDRVFLSDFRILRILERKSKLEITLQQQFPELGWFWSWMKYNESNLVILGNSWPKEVELFLEKIQQKEIELGVLQYVFVPHEINVVTIQLYREWEKQGFVIVIDSEHGSFNKETKFLKPVILLVKGILCEIYNLGKFAIVGGGYQHKVHSLLEPYLAGCQVFCGPGIKYSQEYFLIKSKQAFAITLVDDLIKTHDLISKRARENYSIDENRIEIEKIRSETNKFYTWISE
ncbi:MAG: glycosyltransferase N-terminal domain-containing protein [Bacteriovoracaceae bacterium]|nr:glycosyltransferase N-terminal domain-containing protein [Bacteriovoracaceae bacterium]